jgi:LmbE family N-acetylglucosaminyl deacetylase
MENPQRRRVVRSVWDVVQLLGQIQISVASTFAWSEGQPAHDADHQRCGQSSNAVVREQQDKKRDDATRPSARIDIVTTAQESPSEKRRRADQGDNNTGPKEWSPHLCCDGHRSGGNFERIRGVSIDGQQSFE